jgi:SAM-dependent methyltransferase
MSAGKWLLHNYGRKSNCQRFGRHPTTVRDSNHYNDEYIFAFVERWDYLIDWTARAKKESQFIVTELRKRGVVKILDAATGTGFDSIRLIQEGFCVTSLDGNYNMLVKARSNAKKQNVELSIIHSDWRQMKPNIHNQYDAVICLGNSISHLFTKDDLLNSLSAFYHCLKPTGILLVDHLNYNRIFKLGAFDQHTLYYTGDNVNVALEHFDRGLMRFSYTFPLNWIFFLHYFPILKEEFKKLLSISGFNKISTYGDFSHTYRNSKSESYLYLAEKSI